jgi:hypothetical protein
VHSAVIYRNLAAEAEANMEAVTPPLFLRFVNLLMNDAVFLLDEALSNMAQLRQMQTAREAGEWQQLPIHEREQNEGYLQHIGMIARFVRFLDICSWRYKLTYLLSLDTFMDIHAHTCTCACTFHIFMTLKENCIHWMPEALSSEVNWLECETDAYLMRLRMSGAERCHISSWCDA